MKSRLVYVLKPNWQPFIVRMKDGRITIARPGAGAAGTGGTKKIHPHLALVQIFKNPGATNHNSLVSASHCAAPFLSRGHDDGDMDVVGSNGDCWLICVKFGDLSLLSLN